MKSVLKSAFCIFLSGSVVFASCKKETSCEGCATKNNKPPIAVAGPDRVITLPTDSILLDGSGSSDPDGKISEWLWTKISGLASFNIIKPTDSLTNVKALVVGTYLFELKVTDNGGLSAKDTLRIIVDPVLTTNHPPIANAGADQIITLPTNTVNLDGSASTDPENNITNYLWTKISGPSSFNIFNSNIVQTQVNLIQGIYQFELKVTDAGGLFSKDTMLVTVNAQPDPCAAGRPIINAQLIPVGTLSIPRYGLSIASAGNKLLFAGGSDGDNYNSNGGTAFKRVDIYDIGTQNWSTAELSIERTGMGVAVAGNKIFFAGGEDQNDSWFAAIYKRIDIYDASTGAWTIDSLTWPRISPAGEVVGNKIFFAGGWDWYFGANDDYAKVVDIKDLSTNTWSASTLSETKAYLSSEAIGNKIYFAGGAHGNDYTVTSNRIDVYDNNTASWSTEVLIEPKAYFASIGFAGKIYWAGGATATPINNANAHMSSLVEIKDVTTNTSTQACLFQPNRLFNAVLKNDKIVFFTGEGVVKNKFDIYDVPTNTWSIGVLPFDIYGASIISVNNTIYVAGGYVNDVLSNQVWKLEF